MMDVDGLKKKQDWGKSFKDFKKKEFAFQFARCSDFEDGVYRMRILPPHPERAPEGYHLWSVHSLEVTPENVQKILARESYDSDYDPEKDPSYLDSLLLLIQQNKTKTFDRMTDACKAVVSGLIPWRRFLYPTIWHVSANPYQDDKGYNKVRYAPNVKAPPKGVIWEITADGLVERIGDLFNQYPDLSDLKRGRYIRFRKNGNKYFLDAEPDRSPISIPDLMKDYPNLVGMGKKQKMDDNQIRALVKQAWWVPHFEKLGIDLDLEGGSVSSDSGHFQSQDEETPQIEGVEGLGDDSSGESVPFDYT